MGPGPRGKGGNKYMTAINGDQARDLEGCGGCCGGLFEDTNTELSWKD
jgi:hypothetical protein